MDAFVEQAKQLAKTSDGAERMKLIELSRNLSHSLESPEDTLQRIMYTHLEISAVRVGIDLKLFNRLAASEQPMTVKDLHEETGASAVLLGRLLRYLASMDIIKETEEDKFTSNNVTDALAIPGNQAGVYHQFNTLGPMYQAMPDFLATKKYQDITDNTDTVHQVAHKSPLPAFLWFGENLQAGAYFNEYMAHRRKGQATWLDVYPVQHYIEGWSPEAAVFVDIGGNIGHQCAQLKARYPQLPGKVVLQDLPHPISQALQTPGVQNMIHDMFEPQPVHGSKFYYLRAVLHDWPDDKCRLVLRNIVSAMGTESVILIDEMVLPNTHVHYQTTQIDLSMMAALASIERTHAQWADLLGSVGLRITDVFTYTPSIYESVIRVVRN